MQRTLNRELKELEVVGREAIAGGAERPPGQGPREGDAVVVGGRLPAPPGLNQASRTGISWQGVKWPAQPARPDAALRRRHRRGTECSGYHDAAVSTEVERSEGASPRKGSVRQQQHGEDNSGAVNREARGCPRREARVSARALFAIEGVTFA